MLKQSPQRSTQKMPQKPALHCSQLSRPIQTCYHRHSSGAPLRLRLTSASVQTNKSERLKAAEAEADALRQALTRQAAGGNPADEERCRQAEQLLAQQVCHTLSYQL